MATRTRGTLSQRPPTSSVEEAAELLGMSCSAASRARAGQLKTFRLGRKLRSPTAPLRMLDR